MIVKTSKEILSGYQIVIKASLSAGCRAFFAAPSPFQALLLGEGLARFHESHNTSVQAESAPSALAMALGAASVSVAPPLVSGTLHDFFQVQEVFMSFMEQRLPCVYVVLHRYQDPPHFPVLRSLVDQVQPWGLGLPSLYPNSLDSLFSLTYEAFQWASEHRVPTLLFLDDILFHATGIINADSLPQIRFSRKETQPLLNLELKHQKLSGEGFQKLNASCPMNPEFVLLGLGGLGGHCLAYFENAMTLVPESLWPFPTQALLAELEQVSDLPVFIVEHQGSGLVDAMHHLGIQGQGVVVPSGSRSIGQMMQAIEIQIEEHLA